MPKQIPEKNWITGQKIISFLVQVSDNRYFISIERDDHDIYAAFNLYSLRCAINKLFFIKHIFKKCSVFSNSV